MVRLPPGPWSSPATSGGTSASAYAAAVPLPSRTTSTAYIHAPIRTRIPYIGEYSGGARGWWWVPQNAYDSRRYGGEGDRESEQRMSKPRRFGTRVRLQLRGNGIPGLRCNAWGSVHTRFCADRSLTTFVVPRYTIRAGLSARIALVVSASFYINIYI